MLEAIHFSGRYQTRPWGPIMVSPWLICYRNVLKNAPRLPSSQRWGMLVDGLDFVGMQRQGHYEWNLQYLQRINKTAQAVAYAHGMGRRGWRAARWELYDAVSMSRP